MTLNFKESIFLTKKRIKMIKKDEKGLDNTLKKDSRIAKIGGVKVNSSSLAQVLKEIETRVEKKQKTIIFTPNPEFIVKAQKQPSFKKLLNIAHISIPDGIGLTWAARILGQQITKRISGADLTARILDLANINSWSIGITGARRRVMDEAEAQIARLKGKYPSINFINLDNQRMATEKCLPAEFSKQAGKLEIILACHGMVEQEKWINQNFDKLPGLVFIGIGGSLDFLTGFSKRAPDWLRKMGLEWLWRGIKKPVHFRRIWTAVVEFSWLILKEKLRLGEKS